MPRRLESLRAHAADAFHELRVATESMLKDPVFLLVLGKVLQSLTVDASDLLSEALAQPLRATAGGLQAGGAPPASILTFIRFYHFDAARKNARPGASNVQSILRCCMQLGYTESVFLLLRAGANPFLRDAHGLCACQRMAATCGLECGLRIWECKHECCRLMVTAVEVGRLNDVKTDYMERFDNQHKFNIS